MEAEIESIIEGSFSFWAEKEWKITRICRGKNGPKLLWIRLCRYVSFTYLCSPIIFLT
jgi:hypothetical protein